MKKTILTAALVCAFLGAQAQEYYEKQVTFPVGATLEQKVDMASRRLGQVPQNSVVSMSRLSARSSCNLRKCYGFAAHPDKSNSGSAYCKIRLRVLSEIEAAS